VSPPGSRPRHKRRPISAAQGIESETPQNVVLHAEFPHPSHSAERATHAVVLGTGFGAFTLIKRLRSRYRITVISPRNHFLFTPLLPSTTVGTVEFRSIIEPIRNAREDISFYQAAAESVDPKRNHVVCIGAVAGERFVVHYDVLIIAVGAVSNTYNVPGVSGHAVFLKELNDARLLRQMIVRNFERANLPAVHDAERRRLLSFVICGGGPTGVEFAAELHDFLHEDLWRSYTALAPCAEITVVEASRDILNSFDEKLRNYAEALFRRQHIHVLTGSPVVRVTDDKIILRDGVTLSYGLLLWSTGNGPTSFAAQSMLPKSPRGRFIVNEYFNVKGFKHIFAIGDCAVLGDSPLPETAQVAQQQAKYLARSLNRSADDVTPEPFRYRHLGMLAYIGGNRALADLQNFKGHGRATWVFWRSAYLTRIVSFKNKVLVLFDWIKAQAFGRDVSQF
jgi:NADH:ubiquinone reductase (non-electrogenic)